MSARVCVHMNTVHYIYSTHLYMRREANVLQAAGLNPRIRWIYYCTLHTRTGYGPPYLSGGLLNINGLLVRAHWVWSCTCAYRLHVKRVLRMFERFSDGEKDRENSVGRHTQKPQPVVCYSVGRIEPALLSHFVVSARANTNTKLIRTNAGGNILGTNRWTTTKCVIRWRFPMCSTCWHRNEIVGSAI